MKTLIIFACLVTTASAVNPSVTAIRTDFFGPKICLTPL